jgi:hypothetical protein
MTHLGDRQLERLESEGSGEALDDAHSGIRSHSLRIAGVKGEEDDRNAGALPAERANDLDSGIAALHDDEGMPGRLLVLEDHPAVAAGVGRVSRPRKGFLDVSLDFGVFIGHQRASVANPWKFVRTGTSFHDLLPRIPLHSLHRTRRRIRRARKRRAIELKICGIQTSLRGICRGWSRQRWYSIAFPQR